MVPAWARAGKGAGGEWRLRVVDSCTGHALLHFPCCGPVLIRHVLLFFSVHVASLGDGPCSGPRHTADIQYQSR